MLTDALAFLAATPIWTLAADVTAEVGPVATPNLFSVQNLTALVMLTSMEIVLGIDNIVFIAILAGRLPPEQRDKARKLGLAAALVTRLLLLFSLTWIMKLTADLFIVPGGLTEPILEGHGEATGKFKPLGISGRDLVLLIGGLFLIWKSTKEIHHKMDEHEESLKAKAASSFMFTIVQIGLIDIVFSLDSVITAVGMSNSLPVMVTAVMISIGVMLAFAGRISAFIDKHPTMKMLALSFLLLIGVMLVADGFGRHIPKGYIYFAMAFSLIVETLNILSRRKKEALLHPSKNA